jgi:hypothetical protein
MYEIKANNTKISYIKVPPPANAVESKVLPLRIPSPTRSLIRGMTVDGTSCSSTMQRNSIQTRGRMSAGDSSSIETMTVDEYLTKLGEVYVQKLCENIEQRLPLLDKLLEKETGKLLDSLKAVHPRSDQR